MFALPAKVTKPKAAVHTPSARIPEAPKPAPMAGTKAGPGVSWDFSKVSVFVPEPMGGPQPPSSLSDDASLASGSHTAYTVEELPGPVSQALPAPAAPAPAPPAPVPAPPAPAPTPPAPAPAPVCKITTRTLAAAPDGTANTRTKVGANEQVEVTSSVPAHWTASAGTIVPAIPPPGTGVTAVWTAPLAAGPATVTATPLAGPPGTAAMKTTLPTSRSLTKTSERAYQAGRSGSGFVAGVVVNPADVSLSRLQVREKAVAGIATGYHDKVLGWKNLMHPEGAWLSLNAANGGLTDTVGTDPPGGPPPFSGGTFRWPIPQWFRAAGSGDGSFYSTGTHLQVMAGPTGAETTSKEGAHASRTP